MYDSVVNDKSKLISPAALSSPTFMFVNAKQWIQVKNIANKWYGVMWGWERGEGG